ncbi:MAG: alpha/beta hydrolase [Microcoleaceae cyanobacterium]
MMFCRSFTLTRLSLTQLLLGLSLSVLPGLVATLPSEAAERIYVVFGPANLSIGIDSLETFAREGIISSELEDYMRVAGVNAAEEREAFRADLTRRSDFDLTAMNRFFNTSIGESILEQIGIVISTRDGRNGKNALREALLTVSQDQTEGLTLLNFLRSLPDSIQINLDRARERAEYARVFIDGNRVVVEKMATLSAQAAQTATSVDFSALPDIRKPGTYGVSPVQVLQLTDAKRDRTFDLYLYKPQRWRAGKTPVVIFSHGLSSNPQDFNIQAEQLASYGYVVAAPQHIGSDSRQLQAMLAGKSEELYDLNEFIDRPLDISYVIDELERRNPEDFEGRLDLQKVGVLGHSFGGYAVFALAGATLDFGNLARVCGREVRGLNLSLILQCQALDLPQRAYNFRDPRVKAVIATNPVNSAVFGPQGLSQVKIPVMIGAGSKDPATPAVVEQLPAFVWINSPDKYMGLAVGQAHVNFTNLDAGSLALIESFPQLVLPQQSLIDQYASALAVAFYEVHLTQNEDFRPYLQSAYGNYISREPNALHFVDGSADVSLSELFNQLKPDFVQPISPRNPRP